MAKKSRPNILLMMADQLRADALGCYGNRYCQTPNIDAMARRGVVFRNSFTPDPICVPARASITTGNYPSRATGVKDNDGYIRDDQPRLGEHFKANGYRTYACGKLHYSPYAAPGEPRLTHGFDVWDSAESGRIVGKYDPHLQKRGLEDYVDYLEDMGYKGFSRAHAIGNNDARPCPSPLPEEHHVDAWVASRTIARLEEHGREHGGDPFLIWCSFPKPHAPYDPPFRYAQMYDPLRIPPPIGDESMLAGRNPYLEWTRVTHALSSISPEARRVIKAYYYGLVTFQDAQIGRVMKALEASGQAENTIIMYTADHGDFVGDFGTYFKCDFMEGAGRVPIIVAGPGVARGAVREQLVGLQDLLPTLAELTGCPLKQDVQGLSMVGACNDANAPLRELYYGQCRDEPNQTAMVFDGRFKYIYSQMGATEQLYDLTADPQELVNLGQRPGNEKMLAMWRGRLIEEARRFGDTAMLDAHGKLKAVPYKHGDYAKLGVEGMGWRWY